MAFQENKPQPPQSEHGEIQKQAPESQEQRKESLGDKIKRFAGRISERFGQFGQRKQSAESNLGAVVEWARENNGLIYKEDGHTKLAGQTIKELLGE